MATTAALVTGAACDSQRALARKRIKTVERGLLPAVYLSGLSPKKMSLADRLAFYRVPGIGLAVIDGRRVEWEKSYGEKDGQTAAPLTSETLLQGGAFSQMIAAAVSLKLAERGVLSLDEDIRSRLSSWAFPSEFAANETRLTVRALLSHSAGLSDQAIPGYGRDEPIPTLAQMLDGAKPAHNGPLWVPPRRSSAAKTRYSEAGYVLLEKYLEDVTGKPFAALAQEMVLGPLGLKNSTFDQPLPENFRERAASGHLREARPVAGLGQTYPHKAASGLWTTPVDFASFLLDLLHSATGGTGKILSPASARTLLSPQAESYGFGFLVAGAGDDIQFKLRAKTHGFSAFMVLYPVKGRGAVLMADSDNGPFLIDEILAALAEAYKWPDYAPEQKQVLRLAAGIYESFVGRYEVNPAYVLDVRWEDYYLVIQPTGQAATKFYAEGQSLFYSTDPYIRIQFLKDRDDLVTGLVLRQQDFELEAKKIS